MARALAFFLLLVFFTNCSEQFSKPMFVASTQPVAMILSEIVGTKGEVFCITPPGASPHTYSPKPSDIYKIQSAKALFYVSNNLDSWVSRLKNQNKIELLKMLPNEYLISYSSEDYHSHNHDNSAEHESEKSMNNNESKQSTSNKNIKTKKDTVNKPETSKRLTNIDPHFWLDPNAVKALIPALVDTLCKIDPENAQTYKENGKIFISRLEVLDKECQSIMSGLRGSPVILFHPSFRYFLKRYGLNYLGAIELSPGKEPSPNYLASIIQKISDMGVKALFSEPQLPDGALKSIAEATSLIVYELDPIGGTEGRKLLTELILYNAKVFNKALK